MSEDKSAAQPADPAGSGGPRASAAPPDDPFRRLGLEPRLDCAEEAIREAFRRAGREQHPDAGGAGFEELEAAMRRLVSPAGRLQAWMAARGVAGDPRGAIEGRLMELFLELGPVLQRADDLRRQREAARSALGRALLEPRAQEMRDELEAWQERLDGEVAAHTAGFAALERGEGDPARVLRDLRFLEKWQGELRARFAQLW